MLSAVSKPSCKSVRVLGAFVFSGASLFVPLQQRECEIPHKGGLPSGFPEVTGSGYRALGSRRRGANGVVWQIVSICDNVDYRKNPKAGV